MPEPLSYEELVERLDALRRENELLRETQSECRFRAALEAGRVGTWEWDIETDSIAWSDETARIFGVNPPCSEGSYEAFLEVVHEEDRPRLRNAVHAAMDGALAGEFQIEHRVLRPGGTIAWVEGRGRAERGPDGSPTRVAGTVVDITERKELQDQLNQSQKMETVGRLAGGVAHDFNNLLTAIVGSLELAAPLVAGDVKELLETASEAADRAGHLTRQLLAFARRQVLEIRAIDLAARLHGCEGLLRRLLPASIQLELDIPSDVGTVRADEAQLEQVIVNLAVNAAEAMRSGGKLILRARNVRLVERPVGCDAAPGEFVKISVEDTGTGIDPSALRQVFEPFFTTKPDGAGLGLSTAYGIVRQLGGRLNIRSELDEGTTVDMLLPRTRAWSTSSVPASFPGGQGLETLLAVEDNDLVRGVLGRVLSAQGYTVLLARDGAEALRLAEERMQEIGLVITDVVMPEMSGPELVQVLQEKQPSLRAIYVSGYTDEILTNHGIPADADFLAKPYAISALAARIREVLDRP